MAAVLTMSGIPGEVVGAVVGKIVGFGVTITEPGARVSSGVSPDPDPESSGGSGNARGRKTCILT